MSRRFLKDFKGLNELRPPYPTLYEFFIKSQNMDL